VQPQYESSLIEQSLLLNRRRNEKEHLKRKLEEHFEGMDIIDEVDSLGLLNSIVYLNKSFVISKLFLVYLDKQLDITPKVYLCGTLWHETRGEMIQILKSIMR
jgi:chitin synthase